jgi:hypothetical protein
MIGPIARDFSANAVFAPIRKLIERAAASARRNGRFDLASQVLISLLIPKKV